MSARNSRLSFRVIEGGRDPMPAWVPDRAPLSDDGNPARGLAIAILAGAAMWGIGIAIWWAAVSGACK